MIVFLSNFYNHHQAPLAEQLYILTEGAFRFIATRPMDGERLALGWEPKTAPFVLQYGEDPKKCQALIDDADTVIFGSVPHSLVKGRIRAGRLTLLYSERPYKTGFPLWKLPLRLLRSYFRYGRFQNVYLLATGAYAVSDYQKVGCFSQKAYRWGYFPAQKTYDDITHLIREKEPNSLLWVGRFLDWKHPELPLIVAKKLKQDGYSFRLDLIGTGVMAQRIGDMIQDLGLQDHVRLLGAMPPEAVRGQMERASILLFTSDRREGWGAVLNEAMNSGCATLASHAIGAVPYLLRHEKNGLVYPDGDLHALYHAVRCLLDDKEKREALGACAYETITSLWNGEVAAGRLLILIDALKQEGRCDMFENGPCSRAPLLQDHEKNEGSARNAGNLPK